LNELAVDSDFKKKMELKDYEINQDLRFYYQRKLLKLIRDFDMFADDKDKKE
jgi:hypothetical protein